jgi:hypothetical protein
LWKNCGKIVEKLWKKCGKNVEKNVESTFFVESIKKLWIPHYSTFSKITA